MLLVGSTAHVIIGNDPNFADVTLLFSATGADESTTFTDNSNDARTLTGAGGGEKIDTTTDPYSDGNGTYEGAGNGDYITTTYSNAAFDWNGDDFTVDAWVYAASWTSWGLPTYNIPIMVGNQSPTALTSYWVFGPRENGKLEFRYWIGSEVRVTGTTTLSTSTWYHVAMTHRASDGRIDLYIDGVAEANATVSGTPLFSTGVPLTIGQCFNSGLTGRIADLRITHGTRRYTGNFTPPTARYPTS